MDLVFLAIVAACIVATVGLIRLVSSLTGDAQ